jgi:hypothetical protein
VAELEQRGEHPSTIRGDEYTFNHPQGNGMRQLGSEQEGPPVGEKVDEKPNSKNHVQPKQGENLVVTALSQA